MLSAASFAIDILLLAHRPRSPMGKVACGVPWSRQGLDAVRFACAPAARPPF